MGATGRKTYRGSRKRGRAAPLMGFAAWACNAMGGAATRMISYIAT